MNLYYRTNQTHRWPTPANKHIQVVLWCEPAGRPGRTNMAKSHKKPQTHTCSYVCYICVLPFNKSHNVIQTHCKIILSLHCTQSLTWHVFLLLVNKQPNCLFMSCMNFLFYSTCLSAGLLKSYWPDSMRTLWQDEAWCKEDWIFPLSLTWRNRALAIWQRYSLSSYLFHFIPSLIRVLSSS